MDLTPENIDTMLAVLSAPDYVETPAVAVVTRHWRHPADGDQPARPGMVPSRSCRVPRDRRCAGRPLVRRLATRPHRWRPQRADRGRSRLTAFMARFRAGSTPSDSPPAWNLSNGWLSCSTNSPQRRRVTRDSGV